MIWILIVFLVYIAGAVLTYRHVNKKINEANKQPTGQEAQILLTMISLWIFFYPELDVIIRNMEDAND